MYLRKRFIDIFSNLVTYSKNPLPIKRGHIEAQVIAHAMGEWNGQSYLNCQQAFEENYKKGVRYFEVDLYKTSDNKIVCFHDVHEERFGLCHGFTEADFKLAAPYGARLLVLESIAKLLKNHPDAYIITDVKNDNYTALCEVVNIFKEYGIDFKKKIIPQIYNPYEFDSVSTLGFERFIFTVYRFRKKMNLVAKFLQQHPQVVALTVPDKWVHKGYIHLAKDCNIQLFVHTINTEDRKKELISQGASGIYSDLLF